MAHKAEIDLSNITSDGENVIKDLAQTVINNDISAHNTDTNAHQDIRDEITDKVSAHNLDANAHQDIRQEIIDAQLSTQKWKSAVQTKSDLPVLSADEKAQTWLCRVMNDTSMPNNNGVWT